MCLAHRRCSVNGFRKQKQQVSLSSREFGVERRKRCGHKMAVFHHKPFIKADIDRFAAWGAAPPKAGSGGVMVVVGIQYT